MINIPKLLQNNDNFSSSFFFLLNKIGVEEGEMERGLQGGISYPHKQGGSLVANQLNY